MNKKYKIESVADFSRICLEVNSFPLIINGSMLFWYNTNIGPKMDNPKIALVRACELMTLEWDKLNIINNGITLFITRINPFLKKNRIKLIYFKKIFN